ncbi:FxDxF family PEP-CTERM protein [Actimicrobium sp. CCC2.4]|uniref:FxDxF family PEP-CTERM protein n=1 Tax=Actimicrobium sp. CCC2.4 TaxID=3048606 RepID=UPI002AC8D60B|nr:FxDxF family PEP-CTERM protein [Actimicrobium sp. CCC2.4]MEB0136179.1 FxDxF family PEP-CTERM protein [Actimicrobium sp. CCC2.4]WPX33527.1 FxDxF family PEP-CTERM protein [Actimicrobium sp. CCC2.4]
MKFKFAAATVALVAIFASPVALAADYYFDLTDRTGSGDYTGGFSVLHNVAGDFSDKLVFTFNAMPATSGMVDVLTASASVYKFGGIFLNALTYTNNSSTYGTVSSKYSNSFLKLDAQFLDNGAPFDGTLTLLASGTTLLGGGTYSGNITATPAFASPPVSPVPEPETYAMMLAGLGLLGFAARRKAKVNQG